MTNRKDCDQRDEILTPLMFSVPGVPVAQPRVKATSRGKHTRVYTPTKNAKGIVMGSSNSKRQSNWLLRNSKGG